MSYKIRSLKETVLCYLTKSWINCLTHEKQLYYIRYLKYEFFLMFIRRKKKTKWENICAYTHARKMETVVTIILSIKMCF